MPRARVALYVVVLAALGLVLRAWLDPIAGVWSLLGLALLVVVVALGLRYPEWEMFTDLLVRGPTDREEACLSFDGVPAGAVLDDLLALLVEHGVVATFFIPLELIFNRPGATAATIGRLAEAGHRLALRGPAHGTAEQMAKQLGSAFDELSSLSPQPELVLPLVRAPSRLAVRRLGRAADRLDALLVGASVGWPDDPKAHQLEEGVAAGALLRLPTSLLEVDPRLLNKVVAAASRARLRWVSLDAWLDD